MQDNEIVQLRKEISRLSQLLDIVLLRNAQLEQQISAYDQNTKSVENNNHSIQENIIGVNNVRYSDEKTVNGAKDSDHSNHSFTNGVKDKINSIHSFYNGVTGSGISNDKIANGVNALPDAHSQINTGVNSTGIALPGDGKPVTLTTEATVQANVRKLMPKAGRRSIRNTAAMLISLHQTPKQSIKDLQKLTGMSEDGMVKRIMSMKKSGLLTRVRGIGLVLTAKAVEVLQPPQGVIQKQV